MTLLVIALAAYLAFLTSRRFVEAAEEVGYPENARTPAGRQRLGLVSGAATFIAIAGSWIAVAGISA